MSQGQLPARRPRVVIIGAGFGGLNAAKTFRRVDVDVLLVDRNNYHKFQPLLYQVATAGLETEEIAHNIREVFRGWSNVHVRLGTVREIDLERRELHFQKGPVEQYDYLIVATGAVTSYFGVDGAAEHAFPLKNLSDSVRLRNHILRQFERYDRDPGSVGDGALHFVVVGGGPTGVETAGALTELVRILRRDFPRIDMDRARVSMIEMLPRILAHYHETSSEYARRVLEDRGVEVLLESAVERVAADHVLLKGGRRIDTNTLVWAAGIRPGPLAQALGVETGRGGRVLTERDLSLSDYPEVFVIGDMAGTLDDDGNQYPQVAPVAVQQGRHAADQILRSIRGANRTHFNYRDQGQLATIGRNAAVAELPGGLRFHGFLAWLVWVFVHIAKLVGFRHRANVFVNWVYNYLTYDRSSRLILDMIPISDELLTEAEDVDEFVQRSMQALESNASE